MKLSQYLNIIIVFYIVQAGLNQVSFNTQNDSQQPYYIPLGFKRNSSTFLETNLLNSWQLDWHHSNYLSVKQLS